MELGFVGLGRMGGNMVRRLSKAGHHCHVFANSAETRDALAAETGATPWPGLPALVAALPQPRLIWVMVPAGDAQHAPEHRASDGQPATDQQENRRCQAHKCLLFAPCAGHTLLTMDSLVAAVFQTIDQPAKVIDCFALSAANNCDLTLYPWAAAPYDQRLSRQIVVPVLDQESNDSAGIFSVPSGVADQRLCFEPGRLRYWRAAGDPASARTGGAQ